MRLLGTFLAEPTDVPAEVAVYVAEQVGAADSSCLDGFWIVARRALSMPRSIVAAYGYRDFAGTEAQLVLWLGDRA